MISTSLQKKFFSLYLKRQVESQMMFGKKAAAKLAYKHYYRVGKMYTPDHDFGAKLYVGRGIKKVRGAK